MSDSCVLRNTKLATQEERVQITGSKGKQWFAFYQRFAATMKPIGGVPSGYKHVRPRGTQIVGELNLEEFVRGSTIHQIEYVKMKFGPEIRSELENLSATLLPPAKTRRSTQSQQLH